MSLGSITKCLFSSCRALPRKCELRRGAESISSDEQEVEAKKTQTGGRWAGKGGAEQVFDELRFGEQERETDRAKVHI